jgi:glucose/mannose-6-phosphate isomerase
MHQLDNLAFVTRLDPKGMWGLTMGFSDQCRRAHAIAVEGAIPEAKPYQNIVLAGMGGSAAGGDFVKFLVEKQGTVPFSVVREYELPNYVNENTLVIASSYSGNTEETLSAYNDAKRRGATILCVTSGGTLAELANQNGDPCILIEPAMPPRAALGMMLVPVIVACERLGIIPAQPWEYVFNRLSECAQEWGEKPATDNLAKQIAIALKDSVGILYGLGNYQGAVANRWRGQINENSKNMVHHATFPELNHNEILGWVKSELQGVKSWKVFILQNGSESAKMQTRAKVTADLIRDKAEVHTITVSGNSDLENILAMTYLGDFVSLYLAAENEVDPENIDSINILKFELSKVK